VAYYGLVKALIIYRLFSKQKKSLQHNKNQRKKIFDGFCPQLTSIFVFTLAYINRYCFFEKLNYAHCNIDLGKHGLYV
jgi:hypothetical protein